MRLGTYVALELALAAGAVGGAWLGLGRTLELAATYLRGREAQAATTATPTPPSRLPVAELRIAPPAVAPAPATVFEDSDDALLAPLAASPVVRVKPNRGGTSLSLRVDFESGARAAFKPEQIHPQSDPRREIAAFRIDRLLGIGHVPPAKPARFAVAELVAAVEPRQRAQTAARLADEAIARGGVVRGELSWWIPAIRDAMIGAHRVDVPEGMVLWASHLQVGAEIPPERRGLVEQIATCVVFDVVIDNADRWSGWNTKTAPDGETLYFMDNTMSFSAYTHGHDANLTPLRRIQRFPRRLVGRLRALTREAVIAALELGDDPAGLAPLLSSAEVDAILARRDHVLEHVDRLIAQHGEDAVLALP